MLPFEPEPLDRLRLRYPAAVAEAVDTESLAMGLVRRPGETRRNVFDFPGGLRLIVSVDDAEGLGRCLHVSASPSPGTPLWDRLREAARTEGLRHARRELRREAEARFRELAGAEPPKLRGWSAEKGVPHWIGKMTIAEAAPCPR